MSKTWKGHVIQNEACGRSATMTFPIERSNQADMLARIVWFLEISASVDVLMLVGLFIIGILIGRNIGAGGLYALFIPLSMITLIIFAVRQWNDVSQEHLLRRLISAFIVIRICKLVWGLVFLIWGDGTDEEEPSDSDTKDAGTEEKEIS